MWAICCLETARGNAYKVCACLLRAACFVIYSSYNSMILFSLEIFLVLLLWLRHLLVTLLTAIVFKSMMGPLTDHIRQVCHLKFVILLYFFFQPALLTVMEPIHNQPNQVLDHHRPYCHLLMTHACVMHCTPSHNSNQDSWAWYSSAHSNKHNSLNQMTKFQLSLGNDLDACML